MERFLLSMAFLAAFLLIVAAMWWGYRNRARRQAAVLPEFPQPPAGLRDRIESGEVEPLLPPLSGVYVSTVTSASWQDRVAIGDVGFRSDADLHLVADGLLIDRAGATSVWIPAEAMVDARTAAGLAGKVMGRDGLLVVRWQRDGHEFDTGFRADDKDSYELWVAALGALANPSDTLSEAPHGEQ